MRTKIKLIDGTEMRTELPLEELTKLIEEATTGDGLLLLKHAEKPNSLLINIRHIVYVDEPADSATET
jgi:hypothetical protein